MTNEEARDVFKELKITTFDGRLSITTKPNDLINASDIAIEAIEKQIPKKPIHKIISADGQEIVGTFCPACGAIIDTVYRDYHHCRCGQAMNWSKDE